MRGLRSLPLLSAAGMVIIAGLAQPVAAQEAEVIHWWTSGGESAAVKVFADKFNEAGGHWIDTAIAIGENARTAGINRIVGGNPPTAMQFNTSKQFDELVANDLLRSLEDVAEEEHWRDVLPDTIVKAITREDEIYAVPVNIHGQNWFWYNTKIFEDAGLEPPENFDQLVALGPKLEDAGVIPFAQGGQPWQERLLFNAILLAQAGPAVYQAVLSGEDPEAVRTDGFRAAAETFGELRTLVDEGSPGRNWNDATNLVITGKAAVQMMGDWAKGEFIAAGLTPGKEYGCTVAGNNGYIMGGDVFVFPAIDDEAARAAQNKLAGVMFAPETQIAFNMKKGSVPVRLDVDVSGMDVCAQEGMAQLQDSELQIGSDNFLSTPDLVGAVQDAITQYWHDPSMDVDTFVENYAAAVETAG
jgi:glucose/mannose transport system substrate-binding protein